MDAQAMTQNDKAREYLLFLLDHEEACLIENCTLCHVAHRIYHLIQSQSATPQWPAIYPWDEPTWVQ